MKKFFITALIAVSLASTGFASISSKVNIRTVNNFKKDFKVAKDVQRTASGGYNKATFIMGKERMEASYDLRGNFIGTSQNLNSEDLPASAKRLLAKKYMDYTVSEAINFEAIDETAYFIFVENEKETSIVKVVGGINSIFKRISKA